MLLGLTHQGGYQIAQQTTVLILAHSCARWSSPCLGTRQVPNGATAAAGLRWHTGPRAAWVALLLPDHGGAHGPAQAASTRLCPWVNTGRISSASWMPSKPKSSSCLPW